MTTLADRRAANAAAKRLSRDNKRARGICLHCPKDAPPGFATCADCRNRANAHMRARYLLEDPGERVQRVRASALAKWHVGECCRCKNPAEDGLTLCTYHRLVNGLAYSKSRRSRSRWVYYAAQLQRLRDGLPVDPAPSEVHRRIARGEQIAPPPVFPAFGDPADELVMPCGLCGGTIVTVLELDGPERKCSMCGRRAQR